jgi:hypothetical protein
VHAFALAIRPGMRRCGTPMVDAIRLTDVIKDMV